jgi:hypothetical protein
VQPNARSLFRHDIGIVIDPLTKRRRWLDVIRHLQLLPRINRCRRATLIKPLEASKKKGYEYVS